MTTTHHQAQLLMTEGGSTLEYLKHPLITLFVEEHHRKIDVSVAEE
jgi:hypothetical protein